MTRRFEDKLSLRALAGTIALYYSLARLEVKQTYTGFHSYTYPAAAIAVFALPASKPATTSKTG